MYAASYKAVSLAAPTAITTTTTSAVVDLGAYASGANRDETYVFNIGGVSGTTPSINVAVLECATTNGTFTAPTAGTSTASAITTNGLTQLTVFRSLRYVETVTTFTSNTTSANVSAVAYVLKRNDPLD